MRVEPLGVPSVAHRERGIRSLWMLTALVFATPALDGCTSEPNPTEQVGGGGSGGAGDSCAVQIMPFMDEEWCTADNCRIAAENCKTVLVATGPDFDTCAHRMAPDGRDAFYAACARACLREGSGSLMRCVVERVDICELPMECSPPDPCFGGRSQEVRDTCGCSLPAIPDTDGYAACSLECEYAAADCNEGCKAQELGPCLACSETCETEAAACKRSCAA